MDLYNFYLRFRAKASESDLGYIILMKVIGTFRPKQRELMASRKAEIVIEGFQRSANTYFVSFFELAQGRPVSIARHLHECWQFRFAEKNEIPCVVLVREPLAAITSAMLRDTRARPRTLLKNYILFYQNILRFHSNSVIARFEDVVSDGNTIIDAINDAYGTEFHTLPMERIGEVPSEVMIKDREALGQSAQDPTRVAVPSKEKNELKERFRAEIERDEAELLEQAHNVYRDILACKEK